MENKIAELKKIKEALEVLINESEKPEVKVGKWYKTKNGLLINYQGNRNKNEYLAYGFSTTNYWHDKSDFGGYDELIPATPSEVQEALTKEYYKRDYIRGKWADLDDGKVMNNWDYDDFEFDLKLNELFVRGCGVVFKNGTWATPIKTKTIDEIAMDLSDLMTVDKVKYLTENKQTIIETLNNL